MKPLTYRLLKLYVDGHRIKQLFVVSLAVEKLWKLAFHDKRGLNSLRCGDIKTVVARNVIQITGADHSKDWRKRSSVELELTPDDANLAFRVAHGVVDLIENAGSRIFDAIVPQLNKARKRVGEHDLKCEEKGGSGIESWEVKLRNVVSGKLLPKVRKQIQELSWKLWPAAQEDPDTNWTKRVCLLLRWQDSDRQMTVSENWVASYAESIPGTAESNSPDQWKPLWGWKASMQSAAAKKAKAKAKVLAKNRLQAQAKAKAQALKEFDCLWVKCRRVVISAKEMRSVSDMLIRVKTAKSTRIKPNLHQRLPSYAKKWSWPAMSFAQDESSKCGSTTGGGRQGWVATYKAMHDIFEFVK